MKVKVRFCPFLIKFHTVKTYRDVDIYPRISYPQL
jgi:hypothetical protein